MNKFHWLNRIIICFIALLALLSCNNEKRSGLWLQTENGSLVYVRPFSDNCSYSWQGTTFENVAHGKGQLSIFDSIGKVSTEQVEAYYGAVDKDLVKSTKGGGNYVGSLDAEDNMSGFGVLVENDNLFIGNFVQGKPDGELKQHKEG